MKIKKNITFFYMDSAEKSIMIPLAKEAESRGYITKITDNKFEKCEIGVYCQHINHPQYSKFSVVMLHDIIQQYSNWPDIWYREPWFKYDIGILPSEQWVQNWKECSQYFYTCPKLGMYKVGWPKADSISSMIQNKTKEELMKEYGLDPGKRTVLYAPAWENDNKQDDFVQAMMNLDVNILIKQWDANPQKFPQIVDNINKMAEKHKGIPNVYILPPSTNIFYAIYVSDILVSEESSTMCEATMMGVPAVSVSDWLIPDVHPSRYPKCDYDFVTCTTKRELKDCIKSILDNYIEVKKNTEELAAINFSNVGKSSQMIMDIIDDAISDRKIRYDSIKCNKKKKLTFSRWLAFLILQFKLEVHDNYREKYAVVDRLWTFMSKLKGRKRNGN